MVITVILFSLIWIWDFKAAKVSKNDKWVFLFIFAIGISVSLMIAADVCVPSPYTPIERMIKAVFSVQ